MLLSMTGFGEGRRQAEGIDVAVEVRSVNGRYFKLSLRSSEGHGGSEAIVEREVRKHISRGSVQVHIRVDRKNVDDYRFNESILENYRQQLNRFSQAHGVSEPVSLGALLALPGVVDENPTSAISVEDEMPTILAALGDAMQNLMDMRAEEGAALEVDLRNQLTAIAAVLGEVEARSGDVVDAYRQRLTERVNKVLAEYDVSIEPGEVIREVSLMAERVDISEEIVRLRSHLEQFESMMMNQESCGRKLDFITQEMFRETNTIGAKASDAEIARHVIEIKTSIERIREQVQNVE